MPPAIGTALSVASLHIANWRGKARGFAIGMVGVAVAYTASVMHSSAVATNLMIDLDAFKVYGIANAIPIAAGMIAFGVARTYSARRWVADVIALVGVALTMPFYTLIVLILVCEVIGDCL